MLVVVHSSPPAAPAISRCCGVGDRQARDHESPCALLRLGYAATVRVATWNMNHWRRSDGERAAGWKFLRDLELDLALVQEAVPPPDVTVVARSGGIGPTRHWGSAVVSYAGGLAEITSVRSPFGKAVLDLCQTFPGSVAVAHDRGDHPTVFVSVYGVLDAGYAITTMHRILSDLTPLLDSPLGKRVILGGDLNASTQLPGKDRARHRNLFERFMTLGLIDLLGLTADERPPLQDCPCEDVPCRHVRTQRHSRSAVPWHNDYLFATKPLADRLVTCEPLTQPDPWHLSDHCPVVAIFS